MLHIDMNTLKSLAWLVGIEHMERETAVDFVKHLGGFIGSQITVSVPVAAALSGRSIPFVRQYLDEENAARVPECRQKGKHRVVGGAALAHLCGNGLRDCGKGEEFIAASVEQWFAALEWACRKYVWPRYAPPAEKETNADGA